jgi:hypothetical protein
MNQNNTAQNGLSVAAAAERAGVAAEIIRGAISRGEIPTSRRIVIAPAEVDRWAEQRGKS